MLVSFLFQIIAIIALCGLALNAGWLELTRLRMQNAADSAALEGAFSLANGSAQWQQAGQADSALNGFANGGAISVSLVNPPASGAFAGNQQAVQATVTDTVNPIFLGWAAQSLVARATALIPPSPCTYLLSTNITPSLSGVDETYGGTCPMYLGHNYNLGQNASVSGPQLYVSGASAQSSGPVSPAAIFGAAPVADPFANIAAPGSPPTLSQCQNGQVNQVITAPTVLPANSVYCGNTTVNGSGLLTFASGLHTFAGSLTINNNAVNLAGNHVTLFLTTYPGYTGPSTISNTLFNLTAATSGTWQGILIYMDRAIPPHSAQLTISNFNPGSQFDGIWYAPGQEVWVSNINMTGTDYFGIVADALYAQNSGYTPTSNYSNLTQGDPFPVSASSLVE